MFHHLHLNATDPARAIEFYTKTLDCEKGKFAGVMDAVWVQKSWLLFTRSATPPPADITSAIWHFGWAPRICRTLIRSG
jgi:catechol 2,3-dioxygenase-like lactoylglutathione lyase family enzyme